MTTFERIRRAYYLAGTTNRRLTDVVLSKPDMECLIGEVRHLPYVLLNGNETEPGATRLIVLGANVSVDDRLEVGDVFAIMVPKTP